MTVEAPTAPDDVARSSKADRWIAGGGPRFVGVVAFALVAVPLLVALVALRSPRWYPIGDLAQTELRVRDVGTGDSPMIGLVGRLGTLTAPGSHPGPLSFWLLAPVYRLLGASSFALMASTVALHLSALGLAVWIAVRRAGPWLAVAIAGGAVWLARAYGQEVLTTPWNPFMPVTWWLVLLLALWSLLCDDEVMLPVAVLAGSFCAQTHIPYLGLFGGLVVCTGLPIALVAVRRRRQEPDPARARRQLWWLLGAVVLGVVLWLPPMIQQLTNDPGNLTVIKDSLSEHTEPAVGLGEAAKVLLQNLDVFALLSHRGPRVLNDADHSILPGLALLLAWAGSALLAWRRRHARLLALDGVLLAGLLLGGFSISRVYGEVWTYLLLWSWGLTVLLLVATAWGYAGWIAASRPRPARLGFVAIAAVGLVVGSVAFTVDNVDAEVPLPELNAAQGSIARQAISYLDSPAAIGGGRDGTYVISWSDPLYLGTFGYGLLDELERDGFHVGAVRLHRAGAVAHRVLTAREATGRLDVVVGPAIREWDARRDVRRIAYVDVRSPAQIREYERLRAQVLDLSRTLALPRLEQFELELFAVANSSDLPPSVVDRASRMAEIGLPAAVYVSAI